MLIITCCHKRKKNSDCQQKVAHDWGSSIPSFGLHLKMPALCIEMSRQLPKTFTIYLQYPVYNLFRFFWSTLIDWQITTSLTARNNRLTCKLQGMIRSMLLGGIKTFPLLNQCNNFSFSHFQVKGWRNAKCLTLFFWPREFNLTQLSSFQAHTFAGKKIKPNAHQKCSFFTKNSARNRYKFIFVWIVDG